jgi:hypothetical protein
LLRLFLIKIDNRALRNERRDFCGADLRRFLQDQIHIFSFRNRLPERDSAAQRRHFAFVQFAKANFAFREIDNLRCGLPAATVEENGALAAFHSQNVASMVRFRIR